MDFQLSSMFSLCSHHFHRFSWPNNHALMGTFHNLPDFHNSQMTAQLPRDLF